MKVKTTVPDSSQIYATGTIVKLSAWAEDTLTNNIDTTSTTVYRPDLTINKTATVDLDNNNVFTTGTTDSTIAAYQNRTIRYKLEYDNIGNATANNAYVTEKDTCWYLSETCMNRWYLYQSCSWHYRRI
jgi:hypothetical protein